MPSDYLVSSIKFSLFEKKNSQNEGIRRELNKSIENPQRIEWSQLSSDSKWRNSSLLWWGWSLDENYSNFFKRRGVWKFLEKGSNKWSAIQLLFWMHGNVILTSKCSFSLIFPIFPNFGHNFAGLPSSLSLIKSSNYIWTMQLRPGKFSSFQGGIIYSDIFLHWENLQSGVCPFESTHMALISRRATFICYRNDREEYAFVDENLITNF